MTTERERIPFDEFSKNLVSIFARVLNTGEELLVENASGGVVALSVATPKSARPLSDDSYKAFRSAAGGWADVDTETLKNSIYESRKSSRPPVAL
ncbi:MAG: hypothetical protein HC802_19635 [Caldilineaceae bacterium]|nr:hypothetical protein [Caldilineaceae bacterium]